jgi:hypothetical protein
MGRDGKFPHVSLRTNQELQETFRLFPSFPSFRLPLTVELFRQLAFFILSRKPISYCRFKRIDVYIL